MPHHGSLAREMRFDVERRLRSGELRAVVATASLELGIDIGSVDLVVQLGSPRAIAVALQRIGRSGHWVGARPKGIFYVTTRDELARMRRAGARDSRRRARRAHDTGGAARHTRAADRRRLRATRVGGRRALRDHSNGLSVSRPRAPGLRRSASRCWPTASRRRAGAAARSCTTIASTAACARGAARVWRRSRAAARFPDTANYNVVVEPDGHVIGTLDEDFAIESMAGDIFLLGTNSWKIRRVEAGVVRVEDAHGAPPSIPFWNGEGLGRTIELSREVCAVRAAIDERDDAAACDWLERECALDRAGAEQAVAYVRAGKAILGVVPTDSTIVAERFFDEGGGMQLDPAHAVRRAHQPGMGARAAQEVLPLVQSRAAGRRDRQRIRALAERSARLSARRRLRVRQSRRAPNRR